MDVVHDGSGAGGADAPIDLMAAIDRIPDACDLWAGMHSLVTAPEGMA